MAKINLVGKREVWLTDNHSSLVHIVSDADGDFMLVNDKLGFSLGWSESREALVDWVTKKGWVLVDGPDTDIVEYMSRGLEI